MFTSSVPHRARFLLASFAPGHLLPISGIRRRKSCWKCGRSVQQTKLFCECRVIQTPPPPIDEEGHDDYFQALQIQGPMRFDLDPSDLANRVKVLQKELHPDKFSQKSAEEQRLSALHSSRVNKAYQVLKDEIARGRYLLIRLGHATEKDLEDSKMLVLDADFLQEIMELNEELGPKTWRGVLDACELEMSRLRKNLNSAFLNGKYEQAKSCLAKMKYFENLKVKAKEYELQQV